MAATGARVIRVNPASAQVALLQGTLVPPEEHVGALLGGAVRPFREPRLVRVVTDRRHPLPELVQVALGEGQQAPERTEITVYAPAMQSACNSC